VRRLHHPRKYVKYGGVIETYDLEEFLKAQVTQRTKPNIPLVGVEK
jgi:hypothetical protein